MGLEADRRDPDSRLYRSRQSRGKKDRRRWCRGKVGVEHVPEIALPSWTASWKTPKCGWRDVHRWVIYSDHRKWEPTGERQWSCYHIERCASCGKTLSHSVATQCPVRDAAT